MSKRKAVSMRKFTKIDLRELTKHSAGPLIRIWRSNWPKSNPEANFDHFLTDRTFINLIYLACFLMCSVAQKAYLTCKKGQPRLPSAPQGHPRAHGEAWGSKKSHWDPREYVLAFRGAPHGLGLHSMEAPNGICFIIPRPIKAY